MLRAKAVIAEAEQRFSELFGRQYTGLLETYETEDADFILITLGSISGLCREVADELRRDGRKAGVIRLRYLRPFPSEELADAVKHAKAVGVLEKDISFGNEGTVFTQVNSALLQAGCNIPSYNFIGGLGGKNISREDAAEIFERIEHGSERVHFIGIEVSNA